MNNHFSDTAFNHRIMRGVETLNGKFPNKCIGGHTSSHSLKFFSSNNFSMLKFMTSPNINSKGTGDDSANNY